MKIKTCISTLRKLQFNRIKDVDELIEITGMVYEDLIYGVFNGENSSRKTFKSVAEGKNWLRVKNNERKNVLIRNDVWPKNRELKGIQGRATA